MNCKPCRPLASALLLFSDAVAGVAGDLLLLLLLRVLPGNGLAVWP
jgi:hypothetical protein